MTSLADQLRAALDEALRDSGPIYNCEALERLLEALVKVAEAADMALPAVEYPEDADRLRDALAELKKAVGE